MASSSSSSSSSDASRGSLPRGLFRPDLYQGQGRNADYVLLSEEEAESKAQELIWGWQPRRDVWALRWGGLIPVALAALPAVLMDGRIRRAHKVFGAGGRLISCAPASFFPAMFCGVAQVAALRDLVLAKGDTCPVCLEVRTTCYTAFGGIVMPSFMSLLGSYIFLKNSVRARGLPTKVNMDALSWARANLFRCRNILLTLGLLQAASVSGVLWLQGRQWNRVNQKLLERMREASEADKRVRESRSFLVK